MVPISVGARTGPVGSVINVENGGTSLPIVTAAICVDTRPATPWSILLPLPFPSKPSPVAIWNNASTTDSGKSGITPPLPSAFLAADKAPVIAASKFGVLVAIIG